MNLNAPSRAHIRNIYGDQFSVECSNCCNINDYTPSDIHAESQVNSTIKGGAIGGAIGLLGGPIGLLIGGAIGGAIGNDQDTQEKNQVKRFNRSY
ncbi:MAG: hypothetical protein COA32_09755 [Fluviicola sp.]|nr:MAG: hypothetical protein COA32_09755 [Fluviicola sp.]